MPKMVRLSLVAILIVNCLGTALLAWHSRKLAGDRDWVTHTLEVQKALANTLAGLVDVETSQRGFIITGNEDFLDLYNARRSEIEGLVARVATLTADNPSQQGRVKVLKSLVEDKMAFVDDTIELRRAQGAEAGQAQISSGRGKAIMDSVRLTLNAMEHEESLLLQHRAQVANEDSVLSDRGFLAIGVVNAGFLVGAYFLIQHYFVQRRRAEELLRQSEQLLKGVLDSAGQGIFGLNTSGVTTFMNPKAVELTGWSEREAEGKHQHALLHHSHPDGRAYPPEDCPIQRTLHDGLIHGAAHEVFWRKNGQPLPVEYLSSPLKVAGHVVGAVVLFTDITDRVELETARQQIMESEHRARLDAERASRAKDEFLLAVSHELRTPLAGVLGFAQLLEHPDLPPEERKLALERIVGQAREELRLVEDLIDLSQVLVGKIKLRSEKVDLAGVFLEAASAHQKEARAKGVRVVVNQLDRHCIVKGDQQRLRQVADHLLDNAIKFSPKDARVQVAVGHVGRHARVTVEDEGKGIAGDYLFKVFDRFWQEDGSLTRAHGGLGIGLSLCRGLLELHDGTIRAIDTGGKGGACIEVMLPFQDSQQHT